MAHFFVGVYNKNIKKLIIRFKKRRRGQPRRRQFAAKAEQEPKPHPEPNEQRRWSDQELQTHHQTPEDYIERDTALRLPRGVQAEPEAVPEGERAFSGSNWPERSSRASLVSERASQDEKNAATPAAEHGQLGRQRHLEKKRRLEEAQKVKQKAKVGR